ncbi:hypothetical protein TRL7639_02250 [Falsiruegeria litorea R37]|uniref:Uncharacterized protein n=1 Tax=Falsiruegeria litorea R37 TaxID=1200284 RepID=A0A1Y5SKZ9_9RHOB|nr:hypothetical protein TRL7639_02250 [Falsiruegeria litorea R37]
MCRHRGTRRSQNSSQHAPDSAPELRKEWRGKIPRSPVGGTCRVHIPKRATLCRDSLQTCVGAFWPVTASRKKRGPVAPFEFRHPGSSSLPPGVFYACGLDCVWGERTRPVVEWEGLVFRPTLSRRGQDHRGWILLWPLRIPPRERDLGRRAYEQPLVAPQVLHFMQVPLRTSV